MSHKQSWFKIRGKPQTIFCISGIHGYLEIRNLFWVLTQTFHEWAKGMSVRYLVEHVKYILYFQASTCGLFYCPTKSKCVSWYMCNYQFYYGGNISNKFCKFYWIFLFYFIDIWLSCFIDLCMVVMIIFKLLHFKQFSGENKDFFGFQKVK